MSVPPQSFRPEPRASGPSWDPNVGVPRVVQRDWAAFEASVREHADALPADQRGELEQILYYDVTSEHDARLFSAHVRALDIDFTPAFLAMEEEWSGDEASHCDGFRRTLQCGFGWSDQRVAELSFRRANFAPIAHLFRDEFAILCLGAYDELATVRAYQRNLPAYERLGPEFAAFLHEVIGDEGWHSSRFLAVLRNEHAHRIGEAVALIAEIRATEGTPYGNTFVLDHDDAIWNDDLFDEVAELLLRRLASAEPATSAAPCEQAEAQARHRPDVRRARGLSSRGAIGQTSR